MARQFLHVTIAVLFWIVFFYYWHLVSRRPINPDTVTALVSLGGLALLTILYLVFWIFHNIRIFNRAQRRNVRHEGRREPNQDWLGRWIVIDSPAALKKADHVVVEVKTSSVNGTTVEEKIFRTEGRAANV